MGAQAIIMPAFGIHASAGQHFGIAASFTAVSLARSYVLRRISNAVVKSTRADTKPPLIRWLFLRLVLQPMATKGQPNRMWYGGAVSLNRWNR